MECHNSLFLCCIIWCLCLSIINCQLSWTDSPTTYPIGRAGMYSGYDESTNLAWFLGGWDGTETGEDSLEIYSYNMTSQLFQSEGLLPSTLTYYASSQTYTTMANLIYFQPSENPMIILFDMLSKETNITNPLLLPIPLIDGCLASYTNKYLIYLGGIVSYADHFAVTANTQIYDFESSEWITTPPNMTLSRSLFACEVYGDYIYAIGGRAPGSTATAAIEKLDLTKLLHWELLGNSLSTPTSLPRSFLLDHRIIVVGGYHFVYLATVDIISGLDDSVIHETSLNHAVARTNIIPGPNHNIIAVGGRDDSEGDWVIDTMQISSSFSTSNPTSNPSNAPTYIPSNPPSYSPTNAPSHSPTKPPSYSPTQAPSNAPWYSPTNAPSYFPSNAPSYSPSNAPSYPPTNAPSNAPSRFPSNAPSNAPSVAPSLSPTVPPTACYEQDDIFSNDGAEESINYKLINLGLIHVIENSSKIIDGIHFSETLRLNYNNKQELHCIEDNSCLLSNIFFKNNDICNMLCTALYSCAGSVVSFEDCKNSQIICNGTNSCADMTVSINSTANDDMKIDCGVKGSCNDLQIDFFGKNHYGNINCFDLNSCDGLNVFVDSENYKNIKLNMYSHSNNILFANGFGFEELDDSAQYVECNTKNKWVKWNNSLNAPNDELILSEYINNEFPCRDLQIECWTNGSIASSCVMKHNINENPLDIASQTTLLEADCYWVELAQIIEITCDGDCATSPTYSPTNAPTSAPTIPTLNPTIDPTTEPTMDPTVDPTSDPTTDPTTDPTLDPTIDPTTEPTIDPTVDPTSDPTKDPTIDPSQDPTIDPTVDPTTDPSKDPTIEPTLYPSTDPTTDPTNSPTSDPTAAPSNAPTVPPTNVPSASPTKAPTESPSGSPSSPPTLSPSHNPTYSPTSAPTRFPTVDIDEAYDTYIEITYSVSNLSVSNKKFIVHNTLKSIGAMEESIESNYFSIDASLRYKDFFVHILSINNVNADVSDTELTEYDLDINNIKQQPMTLQCRIDCKWNNHGFVITRSYTDIFREGTENSLRKYFENNGILFVVISKEADLVGLPRDPDEIEELEDPTALYLSIIVVSCGAVISIISFIYNKLPHTKVDNANVFMPLLISLNIYDFLSDINLCAIIIATAVIEKTSIVSLIFWLALLSVAFILLPFCSNLFYAMRIRRQRTIRNNPSARAFFTKHLSQFILLCVCCAGTYPVLALTSSRLFGLDTFNAGLLSSELHELSKIKIISTIYLENLPQLVIQVLYTLLTVDDGVKIATILAFIASLLSVVASVIIYQARKDVSDEFIVETYFIRLYNSSGISKSDRNTIKFRKGLKGQMGEALCQVFNIPNNGIEIGFVTMNDYGLIVHLQHQIYKDELDTLKKKLLLDSNITMPSSGYVIDITPNMYIERLFDLHRDEVLAAFIGHFAMNNRRKEFEVSYHKHIEEANHYNDGNDDDDDDDDEGDDGIINALRKKMISMKSIAAVFEDEDEHGLADSKEEKEEMIEMASVNTPGGPVISKTFDEFQVNMQSHQLNFEKQIKQQLKQQTQSQMKMRKMIEQQLKQQTQSQMKMVEQFVMQNIDDNTKMATSDVIESSIY